MDPAIAFRVRSHDRPQLEVRVNFGVLTGRTVTQAEIDDLAGELRPLAPAFEIVAEERHEFGQGGEAAVHQVVIEIGAATDGIAVRIVDAAEAWARACFASRHSDLTEI